MSVLFVDIINEKSQWEKSKISNDYLFIILGQFPHYNPVTLCSFSHWMAMGIMYGLHSITEHLSPFPVESGSVGVLHSKGSTACSHYLACFLKCIYFNSLFTTKPTTHGFGEHLCLHVLQKIVCHQ